MKNLSFILMLVLFTFTSCGCHFYGLKSGLNVSTLNGDDTDNLDPKMGFVFGAIAELCIDDKAAIQPEILYSQQGAKYKQIDGYDGTIKLDYINAPIMAKYRVTEKFIVEAGPQFGILLSAKDEYESPSDSGQEDLSDEIKDFDYGVNLGVNYDLRNGWFFGARYNLGLTNINDSSGISNSNNVFQFSVGFKL